MVWYIKTQLQKILECYVKSKNYIKIEVPVRHFSVRPTNNDLLVKYFYLGQH